MITIIQQPPKWSSIYREIWYKFKRQYILPTGTYILETAGSGEYNLMATLPSYIAAGDIVILTDALGKVSKFKCVSNNGANLVFVSLIETEATGALSVFVDCTVIKKGKITANLNVGYRRGILNTLPKIEKYAGVIVYPDDLGVYSVRVDGFLRSYLGEVLTPAISTIDKSLFLHYNLTINEVGYDYAMAVDSIKCGLNGSVIDLNNTAYVNQQLQLNDFVVKDSNSWAFVSNISDDIVVNTILNSEYVPPLPPIAGGDVNIKKTGGALIATITAPADYTVSDSTVAVKKSDGTTIATKTVKAASTDEYLVDDSTVNVKRSDGTLIIAKTVKAASTVDNTVADTTVNLKDGEGNLLSTHSIKAESSAVDIPAPDAILEVKDSAGNPLYGDIALSGETKVVTAPNSGVTLNGAAWIAPRSGQTIAATLKNEFNENITPGGTGANLTVNTGKKLLNYLRGI